MNGKKTWRSGISEYTFIISLLLLFLFGVMMQASQSSSLSSISTYTNPDGLIGYWDLSEYAGITTYDKSDFKSNGTIINGGFGAGKYGSGIVLNGVNQFVNLSYNSIFNLNNQNVTICAWIKPNINVATYIIGIANSSAPYEFFALGATTTGRTRVFIRDVLGGSFDLSGSVLPLGSWFYVCMQRSGNGYSLWENAIVVNSTTVALGNYIDATKSLYIGQARAGAGWFNGTIDEVKIWSRVLSSEEVYINYLGTYGAIEKYYQDLSTQNITAVGINLTNANDTLVAEFLLILNQYNAMVSHIRDINDTLVATNLSLSSFYNNIATNLTNHNTTMVEEYNAIATNLSEIQDQIALTNDILTDMGKNITNVNDTVVSGFVFAINQLIDVSTNLTDYYDSLYAEFGNIAENVWLYESEIGRVTNCSNCTSGTGASAQEVWEYEPRNATCEGEIVVNETNTTYYPTLNLSPEVQRQFARNIAMYLPDYSAQYEAFIHPKLFGYTLPMPYINIILYGIFFMICCAFGFWLGMGIARKMGWERKF